MQQLTAALSTQGVQTALNLMITELMTQSLTAPDQPDVVTNRMIPTGTSVINLNYLSLYSGTVSGLSASVSNVTQNDGGVFSVELVASFKVSYGDWHEDGTEAFPGSPPSNVPFDNKLSGFSFEVKSVTLEFNLNLPTSVSDWAASISDSSQKDVDVGDVNIPSDSVLNDPSLFSCINDQINDAMKDAIEDVNFASALQSALNSYLQTIPTSGNLYDDDGQVITYQFAPSYINYPNNSGLQVGVTGQVLCNGNACSNSPPPDIPAPDVSTADGIVLNAGIYEFNALLWAVYTAELLSVTVTPRMVGNSEYLNTAFYNQSYLIPELYTFAPDADMEVLISTAEAPTVSTAPVWYLTSSAVNNLISQGSLPSDLAASLTTVENTASSTESAFQEALENALSAQEYDTYGAIIVNAAQTTGFYVQTSFDLTVNVLKQGSWVFAFEFQVARNDVLLNLGLQTNGALQTLQFEFSEIGTSQPTVLKSSIGSISNGLDFVYALVDSFVDGKLQQVGEMGVPMPFIQGFEFVGSQISLNLQPEYVSVETNISFNNPARANVGVSN